MMTQEKVLAGRTVIGKVVSVKMNKTIVVQIERKVKHPLYGKFMRKFSKMYAHDAENVCKDGDIVEIQEHRPLSKTKHWILIKVLNEGEKELAE